MRRKLALLLAGALAISALCAGCGKGESADSSAAAETSAEAEEEVVYYTAEELLSATEYDVSDYVTLMDGYDSLSVTISGDYDLQAFVEENVLIYPAELETDRTTVQEGDIVNIDYVGKQDGVAFDGGTAEGYDLTIGSGTFIDGFEDGLIGCEVGTTVDLDLTFPESYSNEDLAGAAVVFTVTINSIKEETYITYDEMTDEYINTVFSGYYETVDDMLASAQEYLDSYRASDVQDAVLEQLLEGCTVVFPEGLLEENVNDLLTSIQESAESAGMEYEDYVLAYYSSYADTVEEFEAYVQSTMESSLRKEMILEAVIKETGLTLSSTDFNSFISTRMSYYGYEDEEEFYEVYGGEAYLRLVCAENKALELLADGATVTEAE